MDADKMPQKHGTKWIVCLGLAVVTFAAYVPVLRNDFINLDDPDYVTQNPFVQQGFSWDAAKWAFGAFHTCNWHPLTWLSHMLDCQLYGLDPAGHHLTSLAFHIANTLLLFLLLENLTARLWPGAFVALLFGLHPMHVESVAWVAERKDVLSGLFFMLTLLAYARYVGLAKKQNRQCQSAYALTLLLFALGLMAKPMLVTLPCLLCLLDFWPLKRISDFRFPISDLKRLVMEKIPFFVLTAVFCGITFIAQYQFSVQPITEVPVEMRLAHTPVAYAWYVLKLFWPTNLSVFYPLRPSQPSEVVGALFLIAILTWLACRLRCDQPYFVVGWFWFLVMLLPVSGLIQVGNQAYADRYTYLPYIGLFIILAWGLPALFARWRYGKIFLSAGALLAAAVCFSLTFAQVRVWKDTPTLFGRALALDRDNQIAWCALGVEHVLGGNTDQAINCFRRATAIDAKYYMAWNNLGRALYDKGNFTEALSAYQMAMQCAPQFAQSRGAAYFNLGNLYLAMGHSADAVTNLQKAVELIPNQPEIYQDLACAFARNHQPEQAAVQFQNAFRIQPGDVGAELALAGSLSDRGRPSEAINHYYLALALDPDSLSALNNLAWLLATAPEAALRDGHEAVRLAEHACQLTGYKEALLIGTLAAAYAEAGRYDDAV
ncbi:MAG TPA: tetratricopeptide repeat protein, partial [Candidatus Nitrosopolaris sp.]|nr:tetratricopeptide repeat protein [Candidatus Nitrosopolaris sp.]